MAMAVWLLGCTAFQFFVSTPFGTQCPTAPVQVVQVTLRDCCGKIIEVKKEAPKPGSEYFVQCRCAEKKTVEHEATVPPKLEPFLPSLVVLDLPPVLPEPWAEHPYLAVPTNFTASPPLRPPVLS